MGGELALRAEVFGGFHQTGPEQHLPVAVDDDARGERVIWIHQPMGEI